jgi:intraflagellar transport protein 140
VATSTNLLKLWDVSRREPKQIVGGRALDASECAGVIQSLRVNCAGTKVSVVLCTNFVNCSDGTCVFVALCLHTHSFTSHFAVFLFLVTQVSILTNLVAAGGSEVPSTLLHVYDVELDRVFTYDFGPRCYPAGHAWDHTEPKLLAVETRKFDTTTGEAKEKVVAAGGDAAADARKRDQSLDSLTDDVTVTLLFATSDYGVLMQDSFAISARDKLMGVTVPYVAFMSRMNVDDDAEAAAAAAQSRYGFNDANNGGGHNSNGGGGGGGESMAGLPRIRRQVMRDFQGMEGVDADTKADLLNFSYFLTIGNMDEAYRAVNKIESPGRFKRARFCQSYAHSLLNAYMSPTFLA